MSTTGVVGGHSSNPVTRTGTVQYSTVQYSTIQYSTAILRPCYMHTTANLSAYCLHTVCLLPANCCFVPFLHTNYDTKYLFCFYTFYYLLTPSPYYLHTIRVGETTRNTVAPAHEYFIDDVDGTSREVQN